MLYCYNERCTSRPPGVVSYTPPVRFPWRYNLSLAWLCLCFDAVKTPLIPVIGPSTTETDRKTKKDRDKGKNRQKAGQGRLASCASVHWFEIATATAAIAAHAHQFAKHTTGHAGGRHGCRVSNCLCELDNANQAARYRSRRKSIVECWQEEAFYYHGAIKRVAGIYCLVRSRIRAIRR